MPGHGACAFPFDPERPPHDEPAFWHPCATGAIAIIDLARTAAISAILLAGGHRCDLDDGCHIVLGSAETRLRLWLRPAQPQAESPVQTAFHLPLDPLVRRRLEATARAQTWLEGCPFRPDPCELSPYQRRRLSLLITLLDADAAGATLRALASLAYPALPALSASQWKNASERRGTHRLLREARLLRDGGYRLLLADA